MLFEEITASSLVKVDEAGKILSPTEYDVNPAGFVIHSAIHMARGNLACALHTHTQARFYTRAQVIRALRRFATDAGMGTPREN